MIKKFLASHLYLFLSLCSLANFFLVFLCYRSSHDRIVNHHHFSVVTNEVVYTMIITQVVTQVSNSFSSSSTQSPSKVDVPCADYQYYLCNHLPRVRLWGRDYFVGSRTSYGVIVAIFPDRVLLDTSFVIANRKDGYGRIATSSNSDR